MARCVVPYSTNSFAGPKLGWLDLDLELEADGELWVLDDTAGSVDAAGKLDLAVRPDVAAFRGSAGARRYDLAQVLELGGVDLPSPTPLPSVDGQSWPVAVGSSTFDRGAIRWWDVVRRRVECGNGIVQADEQCDDGNLEAGDGCSAVCKLEEPLGDSTREAGPRPGAIWATGRTTASAAAAPAAGRSARSCWRSWSSGVGRRGSGPLSEHAMPGACSRPPSRGAGVRAGPPTVARRGLTDGVGVAVRLVAKVWRSSSTLAPLPR